MKNTVINLTDTALVASLRDLLRRDRQTTADVLVHLSEVEARRLYMERACSSMFVYCTRDLGMSEDVAFKRIRCARLIRRLPAVLEAIEDGRLHLAGATVLAPHLGDDNCEELLGAAAGQSNRTIEELVADLNPQPDAPAKVRALPSASNQEEPPRPALFEAAAPPKTQASPTAAPPAARPAPVAPVQPLGERRYKVQFTASEQTHRRLRQAQELLRHEVPGGEIAEVIDRALCLLVETTRRKRFGVGAAGRRQRKRQVAQRGRSRHIPNDVKREVIARDGYRCTYRDEDGQRCTEEGMLELHHTQPFARGGEHSAENVTIYCRAHNQHEGRREFGERA